MFAEDALEEIEQWRQTHASHYRQHLGFEQLPQAVVGVILAHVWCGGE